LKQKIFLGPAGIPTVCRISSSVEGIKTVAEIGLNAMEVEFVRGVHMNSKMAEEVGKAAKEFDVRLSVHAPYYINLSSEEKIKVEASKKRILDSLERGSLMGADIVCMHAGYYGKLTKEQTYEKIKAECKELVEKTKSENWDVILGLETTGKVSQFGTVDEIVRLCKEVKGCGIVVDPAHIFARHAGTIDYSEIFDRLKVLKLRHVNFHFSGIKWRSADEGGNEWHHLPISVNEPPFEPLAKEILKRKIDVTVICESPVLEQDSLIMKNIFERMGFDFV